MDKRALLDDRRMAVLLAMMTAIMPLSVDAYLPAVPEMAHDFGVNIEQIGKSLSSFMLGVACGQLLGGAVSDIKGRRLVALGGLAAYAAGSLLLAHTQSLHALLSFRLLQAFGGGMAAVMAGAVVRDFYDGRQAAQMFALIGIVMMSAPLLAPMLGSVLLDLGGWRSIFVFLTAYSLVVWLLMWRFLPSSGNTGGKLDASFFRDMFARYWGVLKTYPALGFLFFQAFSFASMFVFLTESTFVYRELYGLSARGYAWVFGCNILTMASFNRITAWRLKRGNNAEDILLWGLSIQLAANVLLVAAAALSGGMPPFWLLVLLAMLSVGTQGLVTANTQACFMSYFRQSGGSANALLMSSTSLIGAAAGWVATELHDGTLYVMAGLMLCATLAGMLLLAAFSRFVWLKRPAAE
ncbi:MAG: multidrug effflux MFS transporter [Neisseria sp.]|nr:multidrug effflux MFS transporter [Neisseria sp.]